MNDDNKYYQSGPSLLGFRMLIAMNEINTHMHRMAVLI